MYIVSQPYVGRGNILNSFVPSSWNMELVKLVKCCIFNNPYTRKYLHKIVLIWTGATFLVDTHAFQWYIHGNITTYYVQKVLWNPHHIVELLYFSARCYKKLQEILCLGEIMESKRMGRWKTLKSYLGELTFIIWLLFLFWHYIISEFQLYFMNCSHL